MRPPGAVLRLRLAVVPRDRAGLPLDVRRRARRRRRGAGGARSAASTRGRRRRAAATPPLVRERGSRARRRGGREAARTTARGSAGACRSRCGRPWRGAPRARASSDRISGVGAPGRDGLELAQRAVVVEQDRPSAARARSAPEMRSRDGGVEERSAASGGGRAGQWRASRVRNLSAQRLQSSCSTRFAIGLEAAAALVGSRARAPSELLDDVVHVPRVDEQRPRQHLRRSGRTREHEQRPAPAARETGSGLAEHELLGDEVHPVAERRHHHHVGPAVEGDQLGLRDAAVQVLDRRRVPAARTGR